MKWFLYHFLINKNYCFEIGGFRILTCDKSLIFFNSNFNFNWENKDHSPNFVFLLIVFNFVLIDLDIYNINHINKL